MAGKAKKEAKRTARASVKAAKKKRLIKKTVLTKKRKTWYSIMAPQIFGKAKIGESLVEDPGQLVGKTVKLSLMTLTGDMKKQNVTVGFEIANVANNQGETRMMEYTIVPASIKRMVRRGRSRIDASVVCACKDGTKIRIKPFVLTLNVTNRGTAAQIRNHIVTFLATYAAHNDYATVFKDVVSGKLQVGLGFVARKVYPTRQAGIRVVEVVKEDSVAVSAVPQEGLDIDKLMKAAENAPRPTFKRQSRGRFHRGGRRPPRSGGRGRR